MLFDLKEEAEKRGMVEEEFILRLISESLKEPLDPESISDLHFVLSVKYLREAEVFLERCDYAHASEKVWGAASQIVKAVAAKRGAEIRSYGELHKFAVKLQSESGYEELSTLWSSVTALRQKFYELPPEMVRDLVKKAKKFVEKVPSIYIQDG